MFERLESFGLMNNIYIIYTSDNGFPIGQHRLALENSCAYEEDVNVPMFIRGTGVPKGEVVTSPTSHTDIVPTLFDLAGIPLLKQFDGAPVPVKPSQLTCAKTEHINIEFWGNNFGEGIYAGGINLNNTYKDLHVVGDDYDIACIVWCTNEHELYDMKVGGYLTFHSGLDSNTLTDRSWPYEKSMERDWRSRQLHCWSSSTSP